ncbi:MAG: hypothetical protein QM696_04030 [Steroidobacteraceae bacterium]
MPRASLMILAGLWLLGWSASAIAAEPVGQLRLYALNCGDMYTKNKGFFSDTGEYDGQSHAGISPCFVIRHPQGTLLWNSGMRRIFRSPPGS